MKGINRNSAFNEFLCDWMSFDDGTYVLSAELFPKREMALKKLKEDFGDWVQIETNFKLKDLGEGRVRYCCQGVDWENGEQACMWWLEAKGKGSKPVWTYSLKYKSPHRYAENSTTMYIR